LARTAVAAALAAAVLLAHPGLARANGDPCSDILLITDICIPSEAKIPQSTSKELSTIISAAGKKGTRLKVGLISSPGDLGLIPQLFGKPQEYARFLGQEILYSYDGILLVVMKKGYGVFHSRMSVKREIAALRSLPPPSSGKPADLLKASVGPARRLVALAGTPVSAHSGSDSSTRDRLIIVVGAIVLLAIGAAALEALRSRRKRA
jgi:hypothetical protein